MKWPWTDAIVHYNKTMNLIHSKEGMQIMNKQFQLFMEHPTQYEMLLEQYRKNTSIWNLVLPGFIKKWWCRDV